METSIVKNQGLGGAYTQQFMVGALGLTLALIVVFLALFTPNAAQASGGYIPGYASGTKLESMCANCHVKWSGAGNGNTNRVNQLLWGGVNAEVPSATDGFALFDMDMDGTVTGTKGGAIGSGEYANAKSAARPADTVRWTPMFPDKDGDGCIQLYNRLTEIGVVEPPVALISNGFVGAGDGFITYGPKGWDIDDNDATQGCNANALDRKSVV